MNVKQRMRVRKHPSLIIMLIESYYRIQNKVLGSNPGAALCAHSDLNRTDVSDMELINTVKFVDPHFKLRLDCRHIWWIKANIPSLHCCPIKPYSPLNLSFFSLSLSLALSLQLSCGFFSPSISFLSLPPSLLSSLAQASCSLSFFLSLLRSLDPALCAWLLGVSVHPSLDPYSRLSRPRSGWG